MSEGFNDAGWFIAGVSSVVATLAGAVAMLFKMLESKNTETIEMLRLQVDGLVESLKVSDEKHDECRQDRAMLTVKVSLIEQHIKQLEEQLRQQSESGK